VQVTGTGLEEVVVDPEAIEAMRKLVGQGAIDLPDHRDLAKDPVTLDEVLTAIDRRIQQRLKASGHHIYRTLAEQIENLRQMALTRAEDSVEFLKRALDIARAALQAEKLEALGELDAAAESLLDPHIGALTQIVQQYAPADAPIVIADVVRDIDGIVKQVRFTGWAENQDGDKAVRRELRTVLHKYGLPVTGEPFNSAYAYIRENY
jgi:type I restriction enzyme R subunit